MKRALPLGLALFAAVAAAWAQPAASPSPTAKIEQFTLPNGLTVIVKPDKRSPTAVQMLWVRVGAMDEVDGTTGVAHVLEHMMFKGTHSIKPGDFSRQVAAIGGQENAFTDQDYTGYYQEIPAGKLEAVMRLEADRFANNAWSDEEFKKELEVVKEERRLRTDDNPRAQLLEAMNAAVYMAAPYRRPVVGWMSDLDALKPDDARHFYRRWYVPANAAVVVAGDVDVAEVKRLATQYYGNLPARAVPERKPRTEPEQQGMHRLEYKAPAEQSYVALAFKVPGLRSLSDADMALPASQDALALTMLAAVLDGYAGARLERGLTRGDHLLADSASASNGLVGRGPQLFILDGVPAPGRTPEQLEQGLREQVAKVARDGVSAAELNRVKIQWVAGQVYKRDSLLDQAREIGSDWVLGLPPDADEQLIARLRGVTSQQLQAVAAKYFGDDQLTVAILRPQPVEKKRTPRAPVATGALR
jgi:zinc protease